jgi:hypothetical protein
MPKKKASKKTAPAKAEKVDNEVSTVKAKNADSIHTDGKRISKGMRQKRLFARTDHKPGEAMLFRSKKERQKDLLARTDRTK